MNDTTMTAAEAIAKAITIHATADHSADVGRALAAKARRIDRGYELLETTHSGLTGSATYVPTGTAEIIRKHRNEEAAAHLQARFAKEGYFDTTTMRHVPASR